MWKRFGDKMGSFSMNERGFTPQQGFSACMINLSNVLQNLSTDCPQRRYVISAHGTSEQRSSRGQPTKQVWERWHRSVWPNCKYLSPSRLWLVVSATNLRHHSEPDNPPSNDQLCLQTHWDLSDRYHPYHRYHTSAIAAMSAALRRLAVAVLNRTWFKNVYSYVININLTSNRYRKHKSYRFM